MVKAFAILGAVLVVFALAAFVFIDPILGAFAAIVGVTSLTITWFARDWDEHPTFEQREAARARRRLEKYERTADARARDRARWEAHQARKNHRSED